MVIVLFNLYKLVVVSGLYLPLKISIISVIEDEDKEIGINRKLPLTKSASSRSVINPFNVSFSSNCFFSSLSVSNSNIIAVLIPRVKT